LTAMKLTVGLPGWKKAKQRKRRACTFSHVAGWKSQSSKAGEASKKLYLSVGSAEKHPSAAEAEVDLQALMRGLKPPPPSENFEYV
jgi:hypothetical protein